MLRCEGGPCGLRPGVRGVCSLKEARAGVVLSVLPIGNNPW